jgi:hypothetical protein
LLADGLLAYLSRLIATGPARGKCPLASGRCRFCFLDQLQSSPTTCWIGDQLKPTSTESHFQDYSYLNLNKKSKSIVDLDQDLDPNIAYQWPDDSDADDMSSIRLVINCTLTSTTEFLQPTDVWLVVVCMWLCEIEHSPGGPVIKHAPKSLRSIAKANSSALMANVRHQKKKCKQKQKLGNTGKDAVEPKSQRHISGNVRTT